MSNSTLGVKNNAPEFLAKDGSLVLGSEDKAEDKAELFDSYEDALKFIQDKGIEDDYTPKSIVIQTNEFNESIDSEDYDSKDALNDELMDDEIKKVKESFRSRRKRR